MRSQIPVAFAAFALCGAVQAAPKVTFVQPSAGETLSGVIRQSADCEVRGNDIRRVVFFLDGTQLNVDTSSPWNCDIDTQQFSNGPHTLQAVAYDRRGQSRATQVGVIIDNGGTPPSPEGYSGTPFSGAPIALPKAFAAVDFDRGGQGVAYRDLTLGNTGGQYRSEDVDIIAASGDPISPYAINGFQTGEWLAYTVEVPTAGQYDVAIEAATNYATAPAFHVEVDGVDVTGRIDVPGTGAWSTFRWTGKEGVTLAAGKRVVKVVADTEYFNLRAVSVLATGGSGGGSDPGGGTDPGTDPTDPGGTDPGTTPTTPPPGGTPSAIATFESLGLYWKPPSSPGAAGCTVQYRKSGDTAWRDGLALWYDTRNAECRGSLVHLAPATTYEVRLGMPGATVPSNQLTATTWSENFPIARTVVVPSGTGTLAITEGGTPGGYVLYTAAPGGTLLDAANAVPYNVTVAAPYVIVRGLTLKGAGRDGIRLLDGAHDVVIEDNDISGWGRQRSGMLGMDYDSGVRAECSNLNMQRVVVQRNRIHDPRYGANSWSSAHPEGPQGITFSFCGGNHVIRHNEITSSDGHYYNDVIGGADNLTATGFPHSDTDIYGNLLSHAWDDAIEAEGGNRNVRIWGNYMDQTAVGVATTITATGPLYAFRNVYNRSRHLSDVPTDADNRNVFAKSGSTSLGGGRRYVFHNTLLQASAPGSLYGLGAGAAIGGTGTSQPITNTVSRNNIFHIWKSSALVMYQVGAGNDFGYDLHNGVLNVSEPGAVTGNPVYQPGHGWASGPGGQYALAAGSPGFDAGQRIANFNDGFGGAGPDMGAHEAGAPAMRFGTGTAPPPPAPAPSGYAGTPRSGTPLALPLAFAAVDFDNGGQGVAYHDLTAGNAGGQYRTGEDVDIIPASGDPISAYAVNGFQTGEWLAYTVNVAAAGKYDIAIKAATNYGLPSAFHVEVDGVNVTGTVSVPSTGSWSTFQWVGKPGIDLAAGKRVLKVIADAEYFNLQGVSVLASGATAPNDPPPASSGDPAFTCSFETSPTDCGFVEQAKVSGRATLTDLSREGSMAVRLHTEPGDSNVSGSGSWERNDLRLSQAATDCYEGKEAWWGHSVLFPSDYVVPSAGGVVMDFHHTGSSGQANFHVDAMSYGLRLRGYGGNSVDGGRYEVTLGPVVRNQWYDFVYHVKWSSGADGFMHAYVNGQKKLTHFGPTLYSGMGCYLKLANYHDPFGLPSSVIHDRVRRGSSAADVSLTPLAD